MLENDEKQNFICATEKIRKAISNRKRRQSNSKNAKTVLYFAEKMIDFEKSDYIVGLFCRKCDIIVNLINIIFNCVYIK